MTYSTKLITGLLIACLLLGGVQIQATQTTNVITGAVTNPGSAPGVFVGDSIIATLNYRVNQTPVPTTGNQARYADYSFDLVAGTFSASEDPSSMIKVINESYLGNNFSAERVGLTEAGFHPTDSTGTAFNSTALPTSLSMATSILKVVPAPADQRS